MKFNGIQTDRLENYARRLLGIRQGGIIPTLSPEAALEIGLPETLDAYALADAWPYGAAGNYSAVAGEFGVITATNSSPNLLVTLQFVVSVGVLNTVTLLRGARAIDGAGPITVLDQAGVDWRDTRRTRGNFPTLCLGIQAGTTLASTAVGLQLIGRRRSVGGADVTLPEVVLVPGESVSVMLSVANADFRWEATGTVRAASPDELAAS